MSIMVAKTSPIDSVVVAEPAHVVKPKPAKEVVAIPIPVPAPSPPPTTFTSKVINERVCLDFPSLYFRCICLLIGIAIGFGFGAIGFIVSFLYARTSADLVLCATALICALAMVCLFVTIHVRKWLLNFTDEEEDRFRLEIHLLSDSEYGNDNRTWVGCGREVGMFRDGACLCIMLTRTIDLCTAQD